MNKDIWIEPSIVEQRRRDRKHVVRMAGSPKELRELILMIDPKADVPFGECNCTGHGGYRFQGAGIFHYTYKVRVILALDDEGNVSVSGFEFPRPGCMGEQESFDLIRSDGF